jgi:hypothetical protein
VRRKPSSCCPPETSAARDATRRCIRTATVVPAPCGVSGRSGSPTHPAEPGAVTADAPRSCCPPSSPSGAPTPPRPSETLCWPRPTAPDTAPSPRTWIARHQPCAAGSAAPAEHMRSGYTHQGVQKVVNVDRGLLARLAPHRTPLGWALNTLIGAAVRYRQVTRADLPAVVVDRDVHPRAPDRTELTDLKSGPARSLRALSRPSPCRRTLDRSPRAAVTSRRSASPCRPNPAKSICILCDGNIGRSKRRSTTQRLLNEIVCQHR